MRSRHLRALAVVVLVAALLAEEAAAFPKRRRKKPVRTLDAEEAGLAVLGDESGRDRDSFATLFIDIST